MRAGRPMMRVCRPIDSIFGACPPSAQQPLERLDAVVGEIPAAARTAPPLKKRMSLVSKAYGSTRCGLPFTAT